MGQISAKSRLAAVFGHPVSHSLSPLMQNAAFAAAGIDAVYLAFDIPPDQLPAALKGCAALCCLGLNVTLPLKEAIIPLLDEVTPEAHLIGAVNTVEFRSGRLIGHNTDGRGFLLGLQRELGVKVEGGRVLIVGAGGAARGLAVALLNAGVERLSIANRTYPKAERLALLLSSHFPDAIIEPEPIEKERLSRAMERAEILLNATSVGMAERDPSLIPAELLRKDMVISDIVYHRETRLEAAARAAGARFLPGKAMLLYQGVLSFEIWTGQEAPVEVMKRVLTENRHSG